MRCWNCKYLKLHEEHKDNTRFFGTNLRQDNTVTRRYTCNRLNVLPQFQNRTENLEFEITPSSDCLLQGAPRDYERRRDQSDAES